MLIMDKLIKTKKRETQTPLIGAEKRYAKESAAYVGVKTHAYQQEVQKLDDSELNKTEENHEDSFERQ